MNDKKQLVSAEELLGKTVEYIDNDSDSLFIKFNDGSFVLINTWEHSDYVNISDNKYDTTPTLANFRELYERDFIDSEQYLKFKRMELDENSKREQVYINDELATLKRLRAKYPDVS